MKLSKSSVLFIGAFLGAALISGGADVRAETKKAAKKTASKAAAAVYTVDTGASELRWLGKKVTGQHNGAVRVKSGEIQVDGSAVTGGRVIFDMGSITALDVTDPETNAKLVGHLKSGDFFGTEQFPTAEFLITGVKPAADPKVGGPTHVVSGNLTVKGQTHPLEFEAVISMQNGAAKANAVGVKVDRTLYDIRYGSGKFFEKIGNKAIDDIFTVDLDISAKK